MRYFTFLFLLNSLLLFGQINNQKTPPDISLENPYVSIAKPLTIFDASCSSSVVPPAILNGISITDSFTGDVSTYPSAYTSCGSVNTPENSKYLGQNGNFTYTMNFSAPINNLVIAITAAGSTYDEIFIFTTNVENPTITSSISCFTVITANVIYSGLGSSGSGGAGGIFTISTISGFTSLTISGPGGENGSLLSVCSNSIASVVCNAGSLMPVLSSTLISNSCPLTTVNLNDITANNTPASTGVILTWHTGLPVTTTNQLSPAEAAAQIPGLTYYAAFYDSINNCYSNAAPVTTMTTNVTPNFTQPNSICSGDTLTALPTLSNNGVTGSWSPALNNTATTTYAFTPDPGQCAVSSSLQIVVNPIVIPTFDPINPICSGDTLTALPILSNNGITGSWSPALNNTATTTYTFTPDSGQCAVNSTLQIVVNPIVIPTFNQVNPICSGGILSALPTISNNGISGSWSPALNNTVTTLYTFSPDIGECATTTTMQIIVNENPIVTITGGCDDTDFVITANSNISENAIYEWYDITNTLIGTTQSIIITSAGLYNVIVRVNNCEGSQFFETASVYCGIPKGVSPNGDGNNDFFNLEHLDVLNLQIYNRYGTLVYNKSDYIKEWNGKSNNGNELPDGTYYYLIQFKEGASKTGWVYINR